MGKAPYIIRVSSQKGGVGKTTVAVNLATALSMLNYNVLLVDKDFSNPSVGFHLGFDQVNHGFLDVVNGKATLSSAIITHAPTGMHVLPGSIKSTSTAPTSAKINRFFAQLKKQNYDFIITDTVPGLFLNGTYLKNYDEAIIITTPEMSSCTSAIRLAHTYNKIGLKHTLVVNRLRNKRFEISTGEIEEAYENPIFAKLPEDDIVPLSISEHIPAYVLNQRDSFSNEIRKASKSYAGRRGSLPSDSSGGSGLFGWLARLFRIKRPNRIIERSR